MEQMFTKNNTTICKIVKIFAPFRLDAAQRRVLVNQTYQNVARPTGRQEGDFVYTATVTVLREESAIYTTAPAWASVEIS
jgi:hypothetical protein